MSIGGMYLAVINAVGFGIFGYDKWCAVHRQWRVPEKTLIAAALLGDRPTHKGPFSFDH